MAGQDTPPAEDTSTDDPLKGFTAPVEEPKAPEPEKAAETPAATEPEPTKEPEQEIAAEPDKPADPPAEPEKPAEPAPPAPPPTPPAPAPTDDTAAKAASKAFEKFQIDFAAMKQKVKEGKFDPIDDAPTMAALQIQAEEYRQHQVDALAQQNEQLQQQLTAEQARRTWQAANPDIPIDRADTIYAEELAKAQKKYPNPAAAHAVANERLDLRLAAIRAAKPTATPPAKSAPAKPAVTKGGAQITSSSGGSVNKPPPPKPKTFDDEVEQFAKAAGHIGDWLD